MSGDALGVVARIERSLAAAGFKLTRDSVAGRQVVVGRRSQRRPGRPGARLHTFVLVGVFKSDASREHLDRFVDEAAHYAQTMKGGLRTGAWAAAVAVVDSAAGAGDWGRRVDGHGRGRDRVSFPVLVDVGGGRVVFPDRTDGSSPPLVALREVVERHVAPSTRPG